MAAMIKTTTVTLATVMMLACVACAAKMGGKTEIADVKTNKEVQDLGHFSVEEHNRRQALNGKTEEAKFVKVVEAQKQVVAGVKYYLKISATQSGRKVMFDSVVVVEPEVGHKVLLSFNPSSQ